jgi:hypothetical protein
MVHVLAERVVLATGRSNTVDIALSRGVLDGLDEDARRALELRLGLDRLAADGRGGPRSAEEVASLLGVGGAAEVERLIARALEALEADA